VTVLSAETARKLLVLLPAPKNCDGCSELLGEDKKTRQYGPFTVHICARCDWRWKKFDFKQRSQRRWTR